jgi:predicted nucleic acid-binding protein
LIFLDTSGIYALADRGDPQHQVARARLEMLLAKQEEILTHNYVMVESVALIQHRLGLAAALKLTRDARHFRIEWVTEALHVEAVRRLSSSGRRAVSLVDHVSFLIMRRWKLDTVFAFDTHFQEEGFKLYMG